MNQIHYYLPLRGCGDDSLWRCQKASSAASGASLLTVQPFWMSLIVLKSLLSSELPSRFPFWVALEIWNLSSLIETPFRKNFSFFWLKTPLKIIFFESPDPKNLISKSDEMKKKKNPTDKELGLGRKLKKWNSPWMNENLLESEDGIWIKSPHSISKIETESKLWSVQSWTSFQKHLLILKVGYGIFL